MLETSFTRLVGATAPVQSAPMPGIATLDLVAAVADAGGVGMLPAPLLSPDAMRDALDRLARATRGVFGVSFLVPFLEPACVEVAARGARLVEFFYGDPDPALVKEVHGHGALAGWQVGSLEEAAAAEGAGCDYLVAQGTEAGGHVRGATSLLPLLARVLDAARVPVLAAGGIATARELAAVLACGAGGARMGTRFVAAAESGAHPAYVAALLEASAADTIVTDAFGADWPDAPHRVLRSALEAARALSQDVAGEAEVGGLRVPVPRFSVISPTRGSTGSVGAMALYAGESVTHVTAVRPASAIVAELVAGAARLLAAWEGDARASGPR